MATSNSYNRYCGCPKGERNAQEEKTGSERCNSPLSPPGSIISPLSSSPSVASTTSHHQLELSDSFTFSRLQYARVFSVVFISIKCVELLK
ncbi:hypothetical protein C0J52_17395 [Blattella germanica]|nr:hypothetical protein C0J52_17395 [Blattella germanica]